LTRLIRSIGTFSDPPDFRERRARALADIDGAGVEREAAIPEQAHDGAVASTPLICARQATPMPRFLPGFVAAGDLRRRPNRLLAQLLDAFDEAAGFNLLPAEPGIAGLHVLEPEIQRIHAELGGEIVEIGLAGEGRLRIAEAAECARAELVRVHGAADAFDVRHAIGPARHQHAEAHDAGAVVGIGAGIVGGVELPRDKRAVLLGAGLDAYFRRRHAHQVKSSSREMT
jgi:hypothetical protein